MNANRAERRLPAIEPGQVWRSPWNDNATITVIAAADDDSDGHGWMVDIGGRIVRFATDQILDSYVPDWRQAP